MPWDDDEVAMDANLTTRVWRVGFVSCILLHQRHADTTLWLCNPHISCYPGSRLIFRNFKIFCIMRFLFKYFRRIEHEHNRE
jgi:hypothetical protein